MEENKEQQSQHNSKSRLSGLDNIFGVVSSFGMVLYVSSIGYNIIRQVINPYHDRPAVVAHEKGLETISILENRKLHIEDKTKLPYEPDSIQDDMEIVYGSKREQLRALDNSINILKKDVQEMREHSDVINNQEYMDNANRNSLYGIVLGGVSMVGGCLGFMRSCIRKSKKK